MENAAGLLALIGAVWTITVLWIVRHLLRSPHGSVGLPIAFLVSMTFLYCGGFIYAIPGYTHMRTDSFLTLIAWQFDERTIVLGMAASLFGVIGFALGCVLARPRSAPVFAPGPRAMVVTDHATRNRFILLLSGYAFLAFIPWKIFSWVPMFQAFIQVGRNAAIALVCLGAYWALFSGRRLAYRRWLLASTLIPAAYLLIFGFVSYGFIAFTIMLSFWLLLLMRRDRTIATLAGWGALLTYGLLSVFVMWMTFRDQLRQVIWSDAGLVARLSAVWTALGGMSIFNPFDFTSLDWLNIRLNQALFVGKTIENHALDPNLLLHGKSLVLALIAWIPRFLWPGKPEMGSNEFLSQQTGLMFSQSATFGAGPVIEFYANFGYLGIFFGFALMGVVLRRIDLASVRALGRGDSFGFARWFVVGIALVAPLTDIFFIINTAIASAIVMWFFELVLRRARPAAEGAGGLALRKDVQAP